MSSSPKILVVDDEQEMLNSCRKILLALGAEPTTVNNSDFAVDLLKDEDYDLIFCDLLMPEMDGIQIIEKVQKYCSQTPVVIFTAYGTIDRAVTAMKAGAFDFIEKPFDADHIKIIIEKALKQRELFKEKENLIKQLEDKFSFDNIIGNSQPMRKIFEMIENVALSDANILITGESGTGKELIARSIHVRSNRKTKPFVPVNSGAFPDNLFEAELFGYEKGAFTGASQRKIGLLEYADGGTFFLDEVSELTPSLQSKLLRTLQDQKLRRVGGNDLIQVDIRLISATNKDLKKSLNNGEMREDFFYRINVINIHLPPLRERREDIRSLAEYFLQQSSKQQNKILDGFTKEVINLFEKYNWPGNVRELENVVERAVALAKSNKITLAEISSNLHFDDESETSFSKVTLTEAKNRAVQNIERKYLEYLLNKYSGNITKMAEEAGMTRRNIHRLINQHNFNPNDWRK